VALRIEPWDDWAKRLEILVAAGDFLTAKAVFEAVRGEKASGNIPVPATTEEVVPHMATGNKEGQASV
jgi:hypothetical protein